MPDYLFDTTVLSNLAAVDYIGLLEKRYNGVAFTTVEVGDELRRGAQAGYAYLETVLQQIESINPGGWLHILVPNSVVEHRLRSEFDLLLDQGEASCLALAVSRGLVLVTDDLAARRLAKAHNVLLSGTLGILVALVREHIVPLDEANAVLGTMIQQRYRSPVDRLDDLI
jgi:predicted nucleic acid-binding protein